MPQVNHLDEDEGLQATHPHGVRHAGEAGFIEVDGRFQSTHPHGVRPRLATTLDREYLGFNPRTRTGCDC